MNYRGRFFSGRSRDRSKKCHALAERVVRDRSMARLNEKVSAHRIPPQLTCNPTVCFILPSFTFYFGDPESAKLLAIALKTRGPSPPGRS
jgi:hypothetical protein